MRSCIVTLLQSYIVFAKRTKRAKRVTMQLLNFETMQLHIPFHVMRRLRLLVGFRFQIYFTPLSGVLFTFPSRYLFTIGLQEYLAFPVSAGRFIRAIRVSNYSGAESGEWYIFRIQDYYLLGSCFPTRFPIYTFCNSLQLNASSVLQPRTCKHARFGLFPFRSPLLRESQESSS